jgi:leader peptidase (prepilin peptidase)/N-methyltransferase
MQTGLVAMCTCAAGALGACIGSFLNVCAHRIPRNESVVAPPSRCCSCGTHIAWYDNIPVVSYLALRGRCRWCGAGFSPRYLVVEALTAALTALVVFLAARHLRPEESLFAWGATIAAALAVIYYLVVASMTDLDHRIIPDELTMAMQVLAPWLAGLAAINCHIGWFCGSWLEPDGHTLEPGKGPYFLQWSLGIVVAACAALILAERPVIALYRRILPANQQWRPDDLRGFRIGQAWFIGTLVPPMAAAVLIIGLHWPDRSWGFAVATVQGVLGALTAWCALYLVGIGGTALFRREAMGYGDLKFLAPLGAMLGPVGVIEAFFAATIIGTVVGFPLRILRKEVEIPFGPFLAAGVLAMLLAGPHAHAWAMGLIMPRAAEAAQ